MLFRDRVHAGHRLARALRPLAGRDDVVVLALPRGGVPVGLEVARALQAPLDVLVVRKLALPQCPESALGALASGGIEVLSQDTLNALGLRRSDLSEVIEAQHRELQRRDRVYRGSLAPLEVHRKVVVLVDDGLATGSTMLAAVRAVWKLRPARVIVAVPVGSESACARLRQHAEVVCLHTPEPFRAVGCFYEDFSQLTDAEVISLLAVAAR